LIIAKKISLILFGFSVLLLLIAIALINNTIRLSIYAHRFLIRTMKLIGATKGFIRSPFIWKSIIQGVLASFIAIGLLMGLLFRLQENFNQLINFQNINLYLMVFGGVILLGIIITWISTFFAVNKFLNINMDKLYLM